VIVTDSENEEDLPPRLQRRPNGKKPETSPTTAPSARESDDSSQLNSLFNEPQSLGLVSPQAIHDSVPSSSHASVIREPPLQQSGSSESASSGDEQVQPSQGRHQPNDVVPAIQVPTTTLAAKPQLKTSHLNSMRRTEPPKNSRGIKIVNQPKTLPTPWHKSERAFSTLKFRRNAVKRGRTEGTPELGALSFMVPPPGLTTVNPQTSNDDVYGRRETGARRLQQVDVEDVPRRAPIDDTDSLKTWEANKVPMVCYEWRMSNNCEFGDRKCRFLHRHQDLSGCALPLGPVYGNVIPKYQKPPVTCRYWLFDPLGCRKTSEECIFAHRNTGHVLYEGRYAPDIVDPALKPTSEEKAAITCPFWLFDPIGCVNFNEKCRHGYAHKNTGRVADRKHQNIVTKVDVTLKPVSSSSTTTTMRTPKSVQQPNLRPPDLTCFFWMNGRCKNRPESCAYQHWYTGFVADPPLKALTCRQWAEGNRPHLPPGQKYKTAHKYTGFMSDQFPRNYNPPVVLPETGPAGDNIALRGENQTVVSEESCSQSPPVTFDELEGPDQPQPHPEITQVCFAPRCVVRSWHLSRP